MTKKYKQVKVQMTRNPHEFGIFMVPVSEAKMDSIVRVYRELTGKVVEIWNQEIIVEAPSK